MSADTSIRVMDAKSEDSKGFKKELTFFDLTNIIVGSIVGADIYIASALTAGMIGPFSIIIWVVAGIFAAIIALVFAYCSYYVPKVGGPFAFVSYAFDDFYSSFKDVKFSLSIDCIPVSLTKD